MDIALGHYLTLKKDTGAELKFQNFWIGQTVNDHQFLPFGFSGITVNRSGDNVDASLVFPNNAIARSWADEAIRNDWIATVSVRIIADSTNPASNQTALHEYVGQVASGGWRQDNVVFRLNSVLDAVGGDIPKRTLQQKLVGSIPISGSLLF
jgi:hypothetical protein